MRETSVLITGFGPFPGVPDNPSARLAERLAASAQRVRLAGDIHSHLLPTEWATVPSRIGALLDQCKPRLILHFGVNRRARGFRIERNAYNRAVTRVDASGALPTSDRILRHGADCLSSALPGRDLVRHLKASGHAASASSNAGAYLCNFLYYHSLDWAARQATQIDVAFIHIPPLQSQGGRLSEQQLLRGAEAILQFALSSIAARDTATHGDEASILRKSA